MYASLIPFLGNPAVGLGNQTADTSAKAMQGQIFLANDPWWGCGEFIYAKANSAIRNFGLCVLLPIFNSTLQKWEYQASETGNTANQARTAAVCLGSLDIDQWGWFCIGGLVPVICNANLAASASIGIAGQGQGGAVAAGKQVLNAITRGTSAITVVKVGCSAPNGSNVLQVPNSDGWFRGVFLSGTGIAANTTVSSIDPSGRFVTLSANTTAQVNGSVTATYNNASTYFNVIHLNRPFYQGAIT